MATDSTVQRIADELEIRNLIAELTLLADTASDEELDRYISLFTEDASWVVLAGGSGLGTQERRGHQEILEGVRERRAAGLQGPGTDTRHGVHSLMVRFEAPDRAAVRCYWTYHTNTASSAPTLSLMGEYRNTLVRTPDGWKLARRELLTG
jgi:3-phenylpropionate/cinnamic acid dioxygenase small subunit